MNRNKSQFSRLLALDREIREGRYPNCLTFSAHWEVSQKTVQRDIDFMRDQQGAPIEYDRDRKGFYYSDRNWFLPSLSISEGDLLALLVGARALEAFRGAPVAAELERVFRKLAEMLPEKLTLKPELIFSRFSFSGPPSKPVDEKIWTTVVRGLISQRSVEIAYRPLESQKDSVRAIDPWHIANLAGEWYVLAHCHSAGELRQFSIPRIVKAKLTDKQFRVPDDFDAAKLLAPTFSRLVLTDGKPHRVRLLFNKEVAPWVLERQWSRTQKAHTRRHGDIELRFEAASLQEVFRWVLSWGRDVRVLEPAELRNWVKDEVKSMVRHSQWRSATANWRQNT